MMIEFALNKRIISGSETFLKKILILSYEVSFGHDLELNYEKKWYICLVDFDVCVCSCSCLDLFKGGLRLELGLGCFRFWLCVGLSGKYRYAIDRSTRIIKRIKTIQMIRIHRIHTAYLNAPLQYFSEF